MWQWGGLKQTTSPCDEKISLPPHDRHKDMSRCYFKGKGFGGKERSRRDSSTPNQGSKPWIMEKKGPKSEITEPISEPPPGSHRSVTLLMPLQGPSEGRNISPEQNQRFPECLILPTSLQKWLQNRLALPTQLYPGKGKNDGVQGMELSQFLCFRVQHQTLWGRGRVTAWTGEGAILLFAS